MKEWGQGERRSSVVLKIEAIALSIAWAFTALAVIIALVGPSPSEAHPGGLAADECHNEEERREALSFWPQRR
jgi:hypothetical protein